jgi:hypothetical protein
VDLIEIAGDGRGVKVLEARVHDKATWLAADPSHLAASHAIELRLLQNLSFPRFAISAYGIQGCGLAQFCLMGKGSRSRTREWPE